MTMTGTTRLFALAALLSCSACSLPSTTHAQVVVTDPSLVAPTRLAIERWSRATGGGVEFELVESCDAGADACVTVRLGMPTEKWDHADGNTTWGGCTAPGCSYDATVWVHPRTQDVGLEDPGAPAYVVTHELGHVLGLSHVDGDPRDVMRSNMGGSSAACITTLDLYSMGYPLDQKEECWEMVEDPANGWVK